MLKLFYGSIATEQYLQNAFDTIEEAATDGADTVYYFEIVFPQLKKKIVSDIEFDDEENVKNEVALPIEIADELDIFFNPKHDNNDEQLSSTNDQNVKSIKSYIIQKPKLFYDEIKEVTKAMLESKIFT